MVILHVLTESLAPWCITKRKYCSVAFQRMVTLHGFIQKLEPHCITKQTEPHESTVQLLSKEWSKGVAFTQRLKRKEEAFLMLEAQLWINITKFVNHNVVFSGMV